MSETNDREAFLRGAADGILKEGLVSAEHYDRLASWLRTVWLAARGEEFGESVEVHGSEHWDGSPSEEG